MSKYNIKLVPKNKYIIKSQIQGKQKTPIKFKWTNKYIMSKEIKKSLFIYKLQRIQ